MGIITDEQRVVCTSCQFVFCRFCLQGFHIGECLQPGQDSIGGNHGNEGRQTCLFYIYSLHKYSSNGVEILQYKILTEIFIDILTCRMLLHWYTNI
jgi:hypothetical protein